MFLEKQCKHYFKYQVLNFCEVLKSKECQSGINKSCDKLYSPLKINENKLTVNDMLMKRKNKFTNELIILSSEDELNENNKSGKNFKLQRL